MADLLTRAERVLKSNRATPAELIALIREVNPTGLDLNRIFTLTGQLESTLPPQMQNPCCAPSGPGYVGANGLVEDEPLGLWRCEPGGPAIFCGEVEDRDPTAIRHDATSLVHALWYLLCHDRSGAPSRLFAYALTEGRLERRWAVDAPHEASLLGDLGSQRVFLVAGGERGPRVVELGAEAPRLEPLGEARARLPGTALDGLWCWPAPGGKAFDAVEEVQPGLPLDARRRILERVLAPLDPWVAADVVSTLRRRRRTEDAELALEVAERQRPGHGAFALARAELAFHAAELERAELHLRAASAAAAEFAPRARAHLFHVEGLAAYAQGRLSVALEKFVAAAAIEECRCDLEGWVRMLRALTGGEGSGEAGELVATLRRADAAGKRGEFEEQLRLLDCRAVWRAFDDQLAARLALAVAEVKDPPPIRRRLILAAAFKRLQSEDRRQLPLGELELPPESLAMALGVARALAEAESG